MVSRAHIRQHSKEQGTNVTPIKDSKEAEQAFQMLFAPAQSKKGPKAVN